MNTKDTIKVIAIVGPTGTGKTKYATKLIKLIAERIKIISQNPESFKSTNYPETRESAMGHFSLYYKLTKNKIIITAFWDNRQEPIKILESITGI